LNAIDTYGKVTADTEGMSPEKIEEEKKAYMDSLLLDALKLRSHYAVAGEIAATYVEVSRKHIIKGINEVDSLGIMGNEENSREETERKTKAITDYARKAQ
jgi:hypothetical protein